MARFAVIQTEGKRRQFVNLDLVRFVEDMPDEGSVRVEFDENHRVYLDRDKVKDVLESLAK